MRNQKISKLLLLCLLIISTFNAYSQLPPPPPPPCITPPCNVPVNSGIILLIAAGLVLGIFMLYRTQKKKAI
jgi:hypothetical protein